jgi:excisionase family DNA binding protein
VRVTDPVVMPHIVAESPWLDIATAALYSKCGAKTLRAAIKRGELKAARVQRRKIIIKREWLDTFLSAAAERSNVRAANEETAA